MLTMAHDQAAIERSRTATGLALALTSATSFGLSGAIARGLLDAGWSTGAAVTARVAIAALVLLVPAVLVLRGRWVLLRRNATLLTAYGLIAVAGAKIWVDNKVDFSQNKNLIVAAITLILGTGDFTLKFGQFALGGIGTATFGAILLYALLNRED